MSVETRRGPEKSTTANSRLKSSAFIRLMIAAVATVGLLFGFERLAVQRLETRLAEFQRNEEVESDDDHSSRIPDDRNACLVLAHAPKGGPPSPETLQSLIQSIDECTVYEVPAEGNAALVASRNQHDFLSAAKTSALQSLKRGDWRKSFSIAMSLLRLARLEHEQTKYTFAQVGAAEARTNGVGILIEVLRRSPVDARRRGTLECELALHNDPWAAVRRTTRYGRQYRLSHWRETRDRLLPSFVWQWRAVYRVPSRLVELSDKVQYAENVEFQIKSLDEPFTATAAVQQRIARTNGPLHPIASAIMQGSHFPRSEIDRSTALVRCVRLLNALQSEPHKDLDVALAKLPAEAKIDPYTFGGIVVRSNPQGVMIFAAGENCMYEDGGGDDVGLGSIPRELVDRQKGGDVSR